MTPLITGRYPDRMPRAEEGDTPATRYDDHLAAQLLAQRIVFLGTQVDEVSANRVCAQLLLLSAEDARTDISLYINSPGGSVTAGLAIYDTMRLIPNDVSTLAMGFAASMGQFLLSVGTRGEALRPAEHADHDAPAVRGHRRHHRRHRDPGAEPRVHQAGHRTDHRGAHRPERGDGLQGR